MMALHLSAFTGGGPAVEFVLQLFVGSLGFVRHGRFHIVALASRRLSRSAALRAKSKGRRRYVYAPVLFLMAPRPQNPTPDSEAGSLYCPNCAEEVTDPL